VFRIGDCPEHEVTDRNFTRISVDQPAGIYRRSVIGRTNLNATMQRSHLIPIRLYSHMYSRYSILYIYYNIIGTYIITV